jgi:hypothetical protein
MAGEIFDLVSGPNDSGTVNQIRNSLGIACVLMIWRHRHFVRSANCLVGIRQEVVLKTLCIDERFVFFRSVKRCAKYNAIGISK